MIRKLRKQLPSAILARGVAEVRRGSFRNVSKSRSEGRYVDVTQSEEGRSVPKRCDGLDLHLAVSATCLKPCLGPNLTTRKRCDVRSKATTLDIVEADIAAI